MVSKLIDMADATGMVRDGMRLGIGGTPTSRKPMAFVRALAQTGVRGIRLYTFLGSVDVEMLVAAQLVDQVHAGYVGLEHLGEAPAYRAATAAGDVVRYEYSEFMFVAGLRAAMAGLPFLPTRGGAGSELTTELGWSYVRCPYTGEDLLAAPAIEPDVTVIHAEAADERGNVIGPREPDFLFDLDANTARAARQVIVSVERIADRAEIRRTNRRRLLFGIEVTGIVHAPRGAWPTALPGVYGSDQAALAAHGGRADHAGARHG